MKRALKALISLYPRPWRNRYRGEFDALLDDVRPTWRTLFDVFRGAVKMQMKIWSPWKIVASFAALGVLGAAAYSLTIPERYVSTEVVRIGRDEGQAQLEKVLSRASLTQIINEQDLYKSERAKEPIEDVIERMKREDLKIAPLLASDETFYISFTGPDAALAQRTTQRLASQFLVATSGAVIDPASLATQAKNPRPSRIMIMGLIAGVIAGVLVAVFNGLKVWKVATALGIAGAVLSGAASYLEPERFSSSAVLSYRAADEVRMGEMVGAVTADANLHTIVQQFGLYGGHSGAERRLREHLHIQRIRSARAILIQFDDPDRRTAQKVTQQVVKLFIGQNWYFDVVDPASFPQRPVFPNRSVVAGMGLFLGLAIAIGLGVRRYYQGSLTVVAAR
jgi:capsular polysaccharide biosynthesis protein